MQNPIKLSLLILFLLLIINCNLGNAQVVININNRSNISSLDKRNLSIGEKIGASNKIRGLMLFKDIKNIVTKDKFVTLLTQFVDSNYNIAFTHLGDRLDFFHAHFLFKRDALNETRLDPELILYHTQERANLFNPGDEYYYLNKENRNFIQYLSNPEIIINAREMVDVNNIGSSFLVDSFVNFYTIHSMTLNPKMVGFEIANDIQWDFYNFKCDLINEDFFNQETNVIKIYLPSNKKEVCLMILGECRGNNIESKDCMEKYLLSK